MYTTADMIFKSPFVRITEFPPLYVYGKFLVSQTCYLDVGCVVANGLLYDEDIKRQYRMRSLHVYVY